MQLVSDAQADLANLEPDESVLGNVEYGWWSYAMWIIIGVLTTPLLIGFLILGLVYRAKKRSGCVITNHRIVQSKAGLLSLTTNEVRMSQIRRISTYEAFLGGSGVKVDAGAGGLRIPVTNPREMANAIREQKNKQAAD